MNLTALQKLILDQTLELKKKQELDFIHYQKRGKRRGWTVGLLIAAIVVIWTIICLYSISIFWASVGDVILLGLSGVIILYYLIKDPEKFNQYFGQKNSYKSETSADEHANEIWQRFVLAIIKSVFEKFSADLGEFKEHIANVNTQGEIFAEIKKAMCKKYKVTIMHDFVSFDKNTRVVIEHRRGHGLIGRYVFEHLSEIDTQLDLEITYGDVDKKIEEVTVFLCKDSQTAGVETKFVVSKDPKTQTFDDCTLVTSTVNPYQFDCTIWLDDLDLQIHDIEEKIKNQIKNLH